MAEISPWSALAQMKMNGWLKPGEKPTWEMMERMNEILHDANSKHLRETGRPLYTEYYVPKDAEPIELADGTGMLFW